MIEFALACFFLLITPGPGVLSVAGVGSGFGYRAGFNYLWGLCAGNFMVGMLVATGLAAIVLSVPVVRGVTAGGICCLPDLACGQDRHVRQQGGFRRT
jgi:threonine/homoserine/homoserine lactone efflux protein